MSRRLDDKIDFWRDLQYGCHTLCIVVLLLSIYNVLENQVEDALGDRRLRILEEIWNILLAHRLYFLEIQLSSVLNS